MARKRTLEISLRWTHVHSSTVKTYPREQLHRSKGSRAFFRSFSSNTESPSDAVSSYIVIGNGPIGASIAKHLVGSLAVKNSGIQQTVTVVDGRPSGMGSSHSDRARLIRTFDAEGNVDWTNWNKQALKAFPEIERLWNNDDEGKTKKSFFTRCGALLLGDKEFVARSKQAAEDTDSLTPPSFSLLSPSESRAKWPYLNPKAGCDVALFDPLGGIIDPLAFIKAQNYIANSGNHNNIDFEILSGIVSSIRDKTVELASGQVLIATEKIILCGGAYSDSLLDHSNIKRSRNASESPRASKRTVALLEVSEKSVSGILNDMPTIKYAFGLAAQSSTENAAVGEHSRVEAGSVYILPPVYYPEKGGKWFVKIGGGPNEFFEGDKDDKQQLDDWLSSQGDPSSAEWLGEIGKSLLSGIRFESLESMACVTTTTSASKSSGVIVDDVLGDGSLVTVSACQGKGAGPSDAIGADIVKRML